MTEERRAAPAQKPVEPSGDNQLEPAQLGRLSGDRGDPFGRTARFGHATSS